MLFNVISNYWDELLWDVYDCVVISDRVKCFYL